MQLTFSMSCVEDSPNEKEASLKVHQQDRLFPTSMASTGLKVVMYANRWIELVAYRTQLCWNNITVIPIVHDTSALRCLLSL